MPRSRVESPSRWVVLKRWRTWPRACSARCATRSAGITAASGKSMARARRCDWSQVAVASRAGSLNSWAGPRMALARGVGLPGRVWAGKPARVDLRRRRGRQLPACRRPTRRPHERVRHARSSRRGRARGDGVLQPRDPASPIPALLDAIGAVGAQIGAVRRAEAGRRGAGRFFALSPDLSCVASFEGYFLRLNPAWDACSVSRKRRCGPRPSWTSSIPTIAPRRSTHVEPDRRRDASSTSRTAIARGTDRIAGSIGFRRRLPTGASSMRSPVT